MPGGFGAAPTVAVNFYGSGCADTLPSRINWVSPLWGCRVGGGTWEGIAGAVCVLLSWDGRHLCSQGFISMVTLKLRGCLAQENIP